MAEQYKIIIQQDMDPVNTRQDYYHMGTLVTWHPRYDFADEGCPDTESAWVAGLIDQLTDEQVRPVMVRLMQMGRHWREHYADSDYRYNYVDYLCQAASHDVLPNEIKALLMDLICKHVATILPVYLHDHSGITVSTSDFSDPWDSGQIGYIYITHERATKEGISDPAATLRAEVREFTAYLEGDVWQYALVHSATDEVIDGCSGFYGYAECEREAQRALDELKANPPATDPDVLHQLALIALTDIDKLVQALKPNCTYENVSTHWQVAALNDCKRAYQILYNIASQT